MLSTQQAKAQAYERLSRFIPMRVTEDMLVELTDEVNALLYEWSVVGYYVRDDYGIPISSVEIFTDEDDWDFIRIEFTYH